MKFHQFILTAAAAVTLAFAGCGNRAGIDTAPLEKSFETADGQHQMIMDQAVAFIKKGDYAGALTQLQRMVRDTRLTPEQQQAVKDVVAKLQKVIADAAATTGGQAGKAAGDVQKTLPK